MATDSKIILSKVRVEHSQDALEEAGLLFRAQKYKGAANRSYYAVFHAMRAVLALDGYDSKKHSGVISEFRKLYIKTKIFPNDISNIVSNLFNIRTDSDYNDLYIISKKEVSEQLKNAKFFIKEIKKFLKAKKVL